jgi:hypothetical protein
MPETSPCKAYAKKSVFPGRKASGFSERPGGGDEDLPILTEVVPAEEKAALDVCAPIDAAQFQSLSDEIVESVKKRFSYELPTLLEAVLLKTTEELEVGIATIVETAARDLIAKKFGGGDANALPFQGSEDRR